MVGEGGTLDSRGRSHFGLGPVRPLVGVLIPFAAAALIVFTVVANLTLLDFWRQPPEMRQTSQNAFTGNIALIGGLLLAACGG